MKVAPLVSQLTRCPDVQVILVHTGQHYDPEMSDAFFRDLGIPTPDVFLGVGSGSHAEQTAKIMVAFETVILEKKPDAVVVVGDVNSTLACSLVTAKIGYPVGSVTPKDSRDRPLIVHVEAGLRSFDRSMPEEINRIVTDALSDLLLTASRDADENLKREGIPQEKIFFVGNVMIDTLLAHRERAGQSDILPRLGLTPERNERHERNERARPYAVCTLHRPSNVDDKERFLGILEALQEIGRELPIIYPLHPRTQQRIQSFGLAAYVAFARSSDVVEMRNPITCLEPLGYLDFMQLMANARLVLTDSGGIQEETTILGIPCVTIRENTERPVTISEGTNILGGVGKAGIIQAAKAALDGIGRTEKRPEGWDGKASERIIGILLQHLQKRIGGVG
jgi:UDP-N-acetylglucosamine 2-epimerase (non-hydrolysing)